MDGALKDACYNPVRLRDLDEGALWVILGFLDPRTKKQLRTTNKYFFQFVSSTFTHLTHGRKELAISPAELTRQLHVFPNLTSVHLRIWNMKELDLLHYPELAPRLSKLSLFPEKDVFFLPNADIKKVHNVLNETLSKLSKLTALQTTINLDCLAFSCSSVQSLDLSYGSLAFRDVCSWLPKWTNLERLSVAITGEVDGNSTFSSLCKLSNLRTLFCNLTGCFEVPMMNLNILTQLKCLGLDLCHVEDRYASPSEDWKIPLESMSWLTWLEVAMHMPIDLESTRGIVSALPELKVVRLFCDGEMPACPMEMLNGANLKFLTRLEMLGTWCSRDPAPDWDALKHAQWLELCTLTTSSKSDEEALRNALAHLPGVRLDVRVREESCAVEELRSDYCEWSMGSCFPPFDREFLMS